MATALTIDCSLQSLPEDLKTSYIVSLVVFSLALLPVVFLYSFLFTEKRTTWLLMARFPRYNGETRYDQFLVDYDRLQSAIGLSVVIFILQVFLYSGLLLGQGAYFDESTQTCIPWARWAVYTLSCPLLAWSIAIMAAMAKYDRFTFVALIALTLATGALSAASSRETDKWIWFALGFVPYVPAVLILEMQARWQLFLFVFFTWSLYPIWFGLGTGLGNKIGQAPESYLYLVSDLLTKIAFEYYLVWTAYNRVAKYDLSALR